MPTDPPPDASTPADRARRRLLDTHGLRVGPATADYAARRVEVGSAFSVIGGCARTGRARCQSFGKTSKLQGTKVAADQRAAVC